MWYHNCYYSNIYIFIWTTYKICKTWMSRICICTSIYSYTIISVDIATKPINAEFICYNPSSVRLTHTHTHVYWPIVLLCRCHPKTASNMHSNTVKTTLKPNVSTRHECNSVYIKIFRCCATSLSLSFFWYVHLPFNDDDNNKCPDRNYILSNYAFNGNLLQFVAASLSLFLSQ